MWMKTQRLLYRIIIGLVMIGAVGISAGTLAVMQEEIFKKEMSSSVRMLTVILVTMLVLGILVAAFRTLEHMNARQLKWCVVFLFIIMTAMFLFVIVSLRPIPTTDSLHMINKALDMRHTGERPIDINGEDTGYFGRYKNNYFLTILFLYFFRLLSANTIEDVLVPLYIVTAAGIMLSVLFMYLFAVRFGDEKRRLMGAKVLVLCTLNPFFYFLALWVYSHSIGMPFIMGSLYFGMRLMKAQRRRSMLAFALVEAVICSVGYYIRPTSVFPLLALVVCEFLQTKRWKALKKSGIRLLVCLILMTFFMKGISMLNHSYFAEVEHWNFPVTHWLMMSSHGEGRSDSEDDAFTASMETVEERTKADLKKAVENYRKNSLPMLVNFFYKKLVITWAHGDAKVYQRIAQDSKQSRLYRWVAGDQDDLFRLYCHVFRLITMLSVVLWCGNLLQNEHWDCYSFLLLTTIFGGMLFYLFWEVKESYSIPFVLMLLLIEERGISAAASKIAPTVDRVTMRKNRSIVISAFFGICLMAAVLYHSFVNVKIDKKDYSIRTESALTLGALNTDGDEETIEQEFYAFKPFNQIKVRVIADSEEYTAYLFELCDESGKQLASSEITSDGISGARNVEVNFAPVVPKKNQKYTIRLTRSDASKGKMFFLGRYTTYVDLYPGSCSVNGVESSRDLYLEVSNNTRGSYCSKKMALLICAGIIGISALLYVASVRLSRKDTPSL